MPRASAGKQSGSSRQSKVKVLFNLLGDEFEQGLRWLVVRLTKLAVDGAVRFARGRHNLRADAGFLERCREREGLGLRVRSTGDVQDQKWRYLLHFAGISDRRQLAMHGFV